MTNILVTGDLIVAEIARLFSESEMRRIEGGRYESWPPRAMAFENEYSIVAVWTFDSVHDLVASWSAAQDQVVRLLGTNVVNTDPKSWDGYLVLAAADRVPERLVADVSSIRSDTRRIRKLVMTADDLPRNVSDLLQITPHVRRALAPVLNLEIDPRLGRSDPLDSLANRLPQEIGARGLVSAVVAAYEAGESPLEALHDQLTVAHDAEADHES